MTAEVTLDSDQLAVVNVSAGTRQVIIAPAGSGKTETVAGLVEHLVESEGLESQEILVLSFSRAATSALRDRFSSKNPSLRAVNVRTLDALASRILAEDEGGQEPKGSFDSRIRQATDSLRRGFLTDELEVAQHVVVDEIQDVVGDRAKFVLELLKGTRTHSGAGFTVLGDPQQAIYNFQLKGPQDMTSGQFLQALDMQFAPKRLELNHNYRAISDEAREYAALGTRLARLSERNRTAEVRRSVAGVLSLSSINEVVPHLPKWKGNTAFLCKTNGTALVARDGLRGLDVMSTLQASAEQRGAAAWIAECIDGSMAKVKRGDFEECWENADGLSASAAWRLLKSAENDYTSGDAIDLARLGLAIVRRDLPATLLQPAQKTTTVSTVHRSKGLEYDNVVLVNANSWLGGSATEDDASMAYVALTRARERVINVDVDTAGHYRDQASDRWIKGGFKSWQTFAFELKPTDLRSSEDPARTAEVQRYLRYMVSVGDSIEARLNKELSTLELPIFDLMHEGAYVVGRTTEEFGTSLGKRLGRNRGRWPRLKDLFVDGFESRGAGMAERDSLHLWRAPVVTGLARIDWTKED